MEFLEMQLKLLIKHWPIPPPTDAPCGPVRHDVLVNRFIAPICRIGAPPPTTTRRVEFQITLGAAGDNPSFFAFVAPNEASAGQKLYLPLTMRQAQR